MEAAQLMGIPTNRIVSLTFAVGSALGAIAGILIGPLYLVYPTMGSLAGLRPLRQPSWAGSVTLPVRWSVVFCWAPSKAWLPLMFHPATETRLLSAF